MILDVFSNQGVGAGLKIAVFERISVWVNPSWSGHDVLVLEQNVRAVGWGRGVALEDDLDEIADPVAFLLWLRSGSDINARSFLSLLESLLVPVNKLEAGLLIVLKVVSGLQLSLFFGWHWEPWERAVLVVLTGESKPSEVSSQG